MAEHLNISRRSVQRFLKKFTELNLIEYEIKIFKYKTTPGSPDQEQMILESPQKQDFEGDPRIAKATPGSPKRHQDRQSDTRIAETTPGSPKRHQDRFESSKQASDKGSECSQTIQTYTDFIKTLSDSERERFFEFVEEKTKNFPHPIMDLEAWLAKSNSAGRNRWDIYYQRFVKATTPKSPPKQNRPLRDEIERQRLETIEHYRKEAELKAAQGIEESPDPEDNRSIWKIELEKVQKRMKSKINVECSRDVKTEDSRNFVERTVPRKPQNKHGHQAKDFPQIHHQVDDPIREKPVTERNDWGEGI
ncbi:hypothetical protein [Crocosphaera sp.]|uniref:hypothetical protein n=1 Tax=Crocosphaera sp. TaxID=2729996 RepID=UPI00260EDFC8|nr:hypothetical protein [Crocosphaera sp.]MDJ0581133.1 hypothetical protein [Crocosphaera sp.]